MYNYMYNSPVGQIFIEYDDSAITGLYFEKERLVQKADAYIENSVIKKCISELDLYFQGKLKNFTVKVNPYGTEFRKSVWRELQRIPYGKTISYKELAMAVGNPKASRAVGGANHNNPISIIIPCHRVIGANGSLTGYGGGLEMKDWLLLHEKKH